MRSGKVRRQASPHHAALSPAPPQPHSSASQGLLSESEEKKGVQSKRNLHKSVRFWIDEQPEVLHPVVDDEEALDSLSVLSSETVYRETAFNEEDEVATKEKMRDENSCKFCFVFQPPMPKGQGLNFFSCMICICFQANNYIVRLLGTLSYKHWVKIITLHCFILNYNYFCWLVMLIFFFQPQMEASFTQSWPVMLKTNWSLFKMNYCLQKKSVQK